MNGEAAVCRSVLFLGIRFLSIEIVLVLGLRSCQDGMLQTGRPRSYGLCPNRAKKFFLSSVHPDHLWSTPIVLLITYQGLFLTVK
jgi:hypothetical protein